MGRQVLFLTPSFKKLSSMVQCYYVGTTRCFLAGLRGDTRLQTSCFNHHLLAAASNVTRLPTLLVHGWASPGTRRNAICVHDATNLWRDQQGFPRVGFWILQSWIRRNPQESIPGDTPLEKKTVHLLVLTADPGHLKSLFKTTTSDIAAPSTKPSIKKPTPMLPAWEWHIDID